MSSVDPRLQILKKQFFDRLAPCRRGAPLRPRTHLAGPATAWAAEQGAMSKFLGKFLADQWLTS